MEKRGLKFSEYRGITIRMHDSLKDVLQHFLSDTGAVPGDVLTESTSPSAKRLPFEAFQSKPLSPG